LFSLAHTKNSLPKQWRCTGVGKYGFCRLHHQSYTIISGKPCTKLGAKPYTFRRHTHRALPPFVNLFRLMYHHQYDQDAARLGLSKFGICDCLVRWFFSAQRDLDPTPSDTTKSEGVINSRMIFCDRLLSMYAAHELYRTCDHCDQFFCILHSSGNESCHHYPVVFTDGACSGNGFDGAVSGIGDRKPSIAGAFLSMAVLTQTISGQTNVRSCLLISRACVVLVICYCLRHRMNLLGNAPGKKWW
jgi:hypothetical protein